MFPTASTVVTAYAGGGQANATLLGPDYNEVSVVATAADSVKLPVASSPIEVVVANTSANACQVFGTGTDAINGIASGVGISQNPSSICRYVSIKPGVWKVQPGIGHSHQFPTVSTQTGVTATASGTQTTSTVLSAVMTRVTTVATTADSVTLPVGLPGMRLTVSNVSSNSMGVFPDSGSIINALSANAAYALAAAKTVDFVCEVAGAWNTIPA